MEDPVLSRRSIRKYTDQPVSDEQVERLLTAAMSAPSAGNEQPWQFVVIRDRATLDEIPTFHPFSRMLAEAPVAILVCGDLELETNKGYWIEDCSAATENILIEAQEMGLGTVWLGVYPRQERVDGLRQLLGVPEQVVPFALIPVGYPAEHKPPAQRYLAERVHRERW